MTGLCRTVKRAFTLIELLVVISIIALLMAIMMPSLNKARDIAKRTVCMSNQRSLGQGWMGYAMDNKNIVFAATTRVERIGTDDLKWSFSWLHGETSWVAGPQYDSGNQIPKWYCENQKLKDKCIEMGTLYPYIQDVDVYRCPATKVQGKVIDDTRSYAISTALNGCRNMNSGSAEAEAWDKRIVKKYSAISKPSERMVMIDQGGVFPEFWGLESWNPNYESRTWHDIPPVTHGNGTTVSFADGHAEYHKWATKYGEDYRYYDHIEDDDVDFNWAQKAVWGNVNK